MKLVPRFFLIVATATLGAALLVPSGVSTAKKRVPPLLTYKAMVHVAGGVTFISHHDDLKKCLPGQLWMMREDSDVDIRGNVLVETYRGQQVRTGTIVDPGGARSKNRLTHYEESNYCPPDEPARLEAPECQSLVGRGTASLMADPRRRGPKRVAIGFSRGTGGEQELDCTWGLGSKTTPAGFRMSQLGNVFASITLPLDIRIAQLRTLGVRKKLIRTIRVGGSCEAPVIYRGKKIPTDTTDMKDGECVADGDFVVTIKRLNRVARGKGVSIASAGRR